MPDAYLNDLTYLLGRADDPKIAWFLTAAAAVLGASVGSFLNVVVYRLPRGMSLSHPGSRCPHCRHAIRWFDNVPVLGWLWLGGRCRDCHAPIAARYPLVEALTGALAAGLFWLEVVEHGANLPAPETLGAEASLTLPWLSYGYHLLLALTLVTAGFMAYDRQRLPLRLWAPALLVGFFAPLFWPELRPISALPAWRHGDEPLRGLVDGLLGLAIGWMLGFCAVRRWRTARNQLPGSPGAEQIFNEATLNNNAKPRLFTYWFDSRGQAALTSVVGLFLGWQAACATLLVALLLEWQFNFLLLASRGRITHPVWSSAVTIVLLFGWRQIAYGNALAVGWIESSFGSRLWVIVLYLVAFTVLARLAERQRAVTGAPVEDNV